MAARRLVWRTASRAATADLARFWATTASTMLASRSARRNARSVARGRASRKRHRPCLRCFDSVSKNG